MKIILLTHERELTKRSNTGRLVMDILGEDAELIIWKRKEPDERLVKLLALKQAALLFPKLDSESEVLSLKQINFDYLVILDATWQEARKMFNRSSYLKQAQRVSLTASKPSEFKLRRNQIVGGLSTVECVIELLRLDKNMQPVTLLEEAFQKLNQ
jgi:DTW domain-containing protein YfiP